MPTPEFFSHARISRPNANWLLPLLLLIFSISCQNSPVPPSTTLSVPIPPSLTCPDCELVEVIDVIDANTLSTSIGHIKMYGAYVLNEPSDCASLAKDELARLAGVAIRIAPGPADPVRTASNHYYFYTEQGDSIEDSLIRDGLALAWTQDGKHVGWFLFHEAAAKSSDTGCLWHDYQAFLRGDKNEFRIPGLKYSDSDR